jgi:subtilisin family serine protease
MKKGARYAGAGLLLALLAGIVPGTAGFTARTVAQAPLHPATVPPAVAEQVREAQANGDAFINMDFLIASPSERQLVEQAVTAAGGSVTVQERTYVRAKVPAAAAASLPAAVPVAAVGVNQVVTIDPPTVTPKADQPLQASDAARLTAVNFDPIGVSDFRSTFGASGRGITVAVIDSGIDPGHPALLKTPDGQPKIVDWKDFTQEGNVSTPQTVSWASSFTAADGQRFSLPDRPDASNSARFGYWSEAEVVGYINRDLDRNGQTTDRFGVLLVDSSTPGVFDTAYVDTNNDGDFRDEEPLHVFSSDRSVGHLGQARSGPWASRRLNFAVADLDPQGRSVKFGFDGLGHGTQVAGVLAGNDPAGFVGVAPGAQIMAIKAVKSNSAGEWFQIKDAILYAATHGAQIINVSVGGLAASASKFDSGASDWLNQVAVDYGVLIVLAADNNGPGLSSGATLGNPSSVMAVGSYYSPEMWKRDYNWVVPHETVWFFSGMGPRSDGTYFPSVIAPGGSTTASPQWRDSTGYTTAVGTSVATPHVTGAAALLMETARRRGVRGDWLSVKRALEMGTRKVAGFEAFEQGNGLIQLRAAYSHLEQINSLPALKGRTLTGDGGLLARSYTPGSSAFWLTNRDRDLARVSILSSADWVRPAFSSMTLPPNVDRELPLQINPPATTGVHSALVQVTHQNKYGPSLLLPVTYVRPVEFDPASDYGYSTTETLEAGRYRRYFFQVKPGMSALTATARVPLSPGGQGTVEVHVFRPDGDPVHTARIGVNGDGLTTLFQTTDPVEGVWEVVIVALPDSVAAYVNPAYTLDVKVRPGPVSAVPLRFSVPAGSVTTQTIKVSNIYGPFTGDVEALGLIKADPKNPLNLTVPWEVRQRLTSVIDTFTLPEFTSDMQIEIDHPIPSNVDVSLSIYRLDPVRGWELRGSSAIAGSNHEIIRLAYLPAGTYKVLMGGTLDASLRFQYRRLVGVDEYQISTDDSVRQRARGETWPVALTITAPKTPGRYLGQVVIRDTENKKILGWIPIELSVGQPALDIQPMVSRLEDGKPSSVVLEVRDGQTEQLVPMPELTVNGQRYLGNGGRISVPVVPQGNTQVLEVESGMTAYQFVQQRYTLPIAKSWGPYPMGVDSGDENSAWRRKVTQQLP